jgi:ligand-binding sensor domain-containing protein
LALFVFNFEQRTLVSDNMIKRALLILIIFISGNVLSAQKPVFRHYSVNEGLPSSEVYHITQDSKGYIWIATNMGVSRYNGKEFRNYDIQDGLPENTVFEVYEDETGRVWFIGFPFQLAYFKNDSIIPYKFNSVLRMIAGKGAVPVKKSFRVDKEDNVVFSFLSKGEIYSIDDKGVVKDLIGKDEIVNSIRIIENKNQLFTSQAGGIDNLANIVLKLTEYESSFSVVKSSNYSFSYIVTHKGSFNEIYIVQNDYLIMITPDGEFQQKLFPHRLIWISSDQKGDIWVGTDKNGVYCMNQMDIMTPPFLQYLDGFSVSSFLEDNEGGKWFTTLENGIFYLSSEAFKSYDLGDGFSDIKINCLEIFRGKLYIGTNDDFLNIVDGNQITSMSVSGKLGGVTYVLESWRDSLLWVGTNEYLYSYNGKRMTRYNNNHKMLAETAISSRKVFNLKDIGFMGSDKILLGEARGLSILKDGDVIYNSFYNDNVELRIESIERETDSSFLLGSLNGLWRFTGSRYEFLGVGSPLLKQRITDIVAFGEKDKYILGTKGSGLVVSMNDTIKQISRLKGLSSNSITSLLITGNDLWVGTNSGLNLIDIRDIGKANPNIVVFKKEQGLISNEINQLAGNKDYIYIATNAGLTVFDRKKHNPVKYVPPVYINSVSIMKRDTLVADNYRLLYNQNFITISYYGISFRDGGNLLYKYRLKGLSDDWVTTNNLEVEYAFLPPGDYRFEVIAINSDGIESSAPAVLNFVILSPFWKTWWFILLFVLAIIAGSFMFYSYRLRQIKKEHALQNDTNWYRQQSLTRQMDPHFVFNTLNSIQSYIIKNDRMASSQYLSKFAKLMRLILNNSQKQAVPLSNEIAALNLYMELESLRFQQKFEFSIKCDSSVDTEASFIPAFLIQPFIENAIWHGIMGLKTIGIISVNFTKVAGQLICTIEDNGIGREKSKAMKSETEKARKSLGISLVESRLNLLNNFYGVDMKVIFTDLYSDDKIPAGTRVVINLPIIN